MSRTPEIPGALGPAARPAGRSHAETAEQEWWCIGCGRVFTGRKRRRCRRDCGRVRQRYPTGTCISCGQPVMRWHGQLCWRCHTTPRAVECPLCAAFFFPWRTENGRPASHARRFCSAACARRASSLARRTGGVPPATALGSSTTYAGAGREGRKIKSGTYTTLGPVRRRRRGDG
jgi:hypothetical protein